MFDTGTIERYDDGAPELTVAIPAHNVGDFIATALESVLNQETISLEVIVVDDASTDETADVVESLGDPRIRLIRNEKRHGIGYCHNLIVRESLAPFIAHVDADDVVVERNACATLVGLLKKRPEVAQVHSHFFMIDVFGGTDPETDPSFRQRQKMNRTPDRDYRFAMVFVGNVANGLRTYRKSALIEAGPFREDLRFGIDYEMGLRLLEKSEIAVVPEMLYAYRQHGRNTTRLRFKKTRLVFQRMALVAQLTASGQITYTRKWRNVRLNILRIELLKLIGVHRPVKSDRQR